MMIQRIQTVFLFLAAVCCALLFFFPFAEFEGVTSFIRFSALGITNLTPSENPISFPSTWLLLAIIIVSVVLPIATIFLYKKPAIQLHAIRFTFLLVTILLALVFFYYNEQIEKAIDFRSLSYDFGIYIPLINMLFLLLAMRGIRSDINKIRSIDRLR
ncbi:MAG: DUF4293 domain-containing protein [Lentimicrobiaceae bacterium]|nr:DUF4293 domain-containing protein [Lentimicrobiaceae bacterium]